MGKVSGLLLLVNGIFAADEIVTSINDEGAAIEDIPIGPSSFTAPAGIGSGSAGQSSTGQSSTGQSSTGQSPPETNTKPIENLTFCQKYPLGGACDKVSSTYSSFTTFASEKADSFYDMTQSLLFPDSDASETVVSKSFLQWASLVLVAFTIIITLISLYSLYSSWPSSIGQARSSARGALIVLFLNFHAFLCLAVYFGAGLYTSPLFSYGGSPLFLTHHHLTLIGLFLAIPLVVGWFHVNDSRHSSHLKSRSFVVLSSALLELVAFGTLMLLFGESGRLYRVMPYVVCGISIVPVVISVLFYLTHEKKRKSLREKALRLVNRKEVIAGKKGFVPTKDMIGIIAGGSKSVTIV